MEGAVCGSLRIEEPGGLEKQDPEKGRARAGHPGKAAETDLSNLTLKYSIHWGMGWILGCQCEKTADEFVLHFPPRACTSVDFWP